MKEIYVIIITTVLINNVVLVKGTGVCPLFGTTHSLRSSLGMSAAVMLIMLLSSAATWVLYNRFLVPLGIEYLEIILFVLIIGALVQLCEILINRFAPALKKSFGVYLPLIATNCAVLGLCEENVSLGLSFRLAMVTAFGTGAGFCLAMVLFTAIRQKTENSDLPESFKGMPSMLISASILSLTFMGLTGLAEGLFGM